MKKTKPKLPRGIRNHNPGNIERNRTPWQGMAADQSGDARFIVFSGPEWGLRALARVLRNYSRLHGHSTVRRIITRWAPPKENDTEAYIAQVSNALGVSPDAVLELSNPDVLAGLMEAIIRHENGQQPYSRELILRGISMESVA